MTIIIFIIVLLVTVTVHEWGHYIAAKKSGMLVEEFGFGIPPRLFSWKKGETLYSINALPIGGFVKIAGENELQSGIPNDRQFQTKSWWKKSIVLVAGVVCNIVLAIVLFVAGYMIGMPAVDPEGIPTVVQVVPNSAASEAGLVVGEKIQSISADGVALTSFDTDSIREVVASGAKTISFEVLRRNNVETISVVPKVDGEMRRVGIALESIKAKQLPFGEAVVQSVRQTSFIAVSIFDTLGSLVGGLFGGEGTGATLIGPVGLAREVGSAATIGFTYLLAFTAAISVNLAVLNIMPFPALDGGRLVVVLLEAVTKRTFSQKTVAIIHTVGFLVLLGLMVVLTVGDIRRLI